MADIRPIQTSYAGCLFRSRLEARWAVFFDALGIEWEYEPEGFETTAGNYLPDFRIQLYFPFPAWTWFEVKPDEAPDDPRHAAFVAAGNYLTIARGIPRSYEDQAVRDYLTTYDPPGRYGAKRVTFWAHVNGKVTTFGSLLDGERNPAVDAAYAAARSARFEFGGAITDARQR